MRLSNGWTFLLLIPGFVGCALGLFNSVTVIRGEGVQMQGISVQIAALSVIVVVGVFFLTALVLTRMDSIRRETLLAVGDDAKTEREERLKKLAKSFVDELGGKL